MKVLYAFFLISNIAFAASGTNLIKAKTLSYNKESVELISEGKLYQIDNKLALLPLETVCGEDISLPSKAIVKVKKATKKQMALKCTPDKKKSKTLR